MIRKLRRRHRVVMAVLAVLVPLLLLAAVRARRLPAPMRELPPAARSEPGR